MIKDPPIVEDIRRIHRRISEKFDHDIDRHIADLQSEAALRQAKKSVQRSNNGENLITDTENHEQTGKETRAD